MVAAADVDAERTLADHASCDLRGPSVTFAVTSRITSAKVSHGCSLGPATFFGQAAAPRVNTERDDVRDHTERVSGLIHVRGPLAAY